jgi:DNA-binding Lrp family transcriptional regulator
MKMMYWNYSRTQTLITSFVMINAEREQIASIPDALLKISGVTEVYSVAGDFDLIAIVRVNAADDLARVVTEDFAKIHGISKTKTLIAFRCYTNYDLEHMFQIGFKN